MATLSTEIASYFPTPVLSAATNPAGIALPSRIDSDGACVFADVSGFTAMTETLAARGKEGSEALTGILNRFFDAILEGHEEKGGTVLRFLGDAMVLFFPSNGVGGVEGATRRALVQAIEMQNRVSDFREVRALGLVFELRMKIGLATGELTIHLLGSDDTGADFFPYGTALSGAVTAEHHAEKGDIRLSPEAAELLLGTASDWPAWPSEKLAPQIPSDSTVLLRPIRETALDLFLPAALVGRIRAGLGGFSAEIRRVTTSFVGFGGLPEPTSSEFASAVQAYYLAACRTISRYGGRVNRIDAGDKGNVLHLLFGAPEAHEDDEERCVLATLDLRDRVPRELGLPMTHSIGINTGLVYTGDLGSRRRHEYTVMGDPVNLAARLMQASQPNEILLSEFTSARLRRRVRSVELGAISVKGKKAPVRTFHPEPVDETSSKASSASRLLVGRSKEKQKIRELVANARRGEVLLSICGEPGIGKSRLAIELETQASAAGYRVFRGECVSQGIGSPFLPILPILKDALGLRRMGMVEPTALSAALERLTSGSSDLSALLAPIFGLAIDEPEWIGSLEASSKRARSFDLVAECFESISSESPVLLLIEDTQYIDSASRELLEHLGRRLDGSHCLLVSIHRPGGGIAGWKAAGNHVELLLEALPQTAIDLLAAACLGVRSIPVELRDVIRERSHGNPYFVEEILRSLEEAKALVREKTGRRSRLLFDRAKVNLPDSLQGLLLSRIDRLPERPKMMLKVASVIGRTFGVDLLEEVLPFRSDGQEVRSALDLLGEAGLTRLESPDTSEYGFTQALAQETAYETLPFEVRRDIHKAVGEKLEALLPESNWPPVDLLAHHFATARVASKAARYLEIAGDRALNAFAFEAAAQRFVDAAPFLDEAADDATRFAIRLKAADVLVRIGRGSEALPLAEEIRRISDRSQEPRFQVRAALIQSQAFEQASEYERARVEAERGLSLCRESDAENAAEFLNTIWKVSWKIDHYPDAEQAAERALSLSRRVGNATLTIESLIELANSHRQRGDLDGALSMCDQALSLLDKSPRPDRRVVCLSARAAILDRLGRRDEMILSYSEGIAEAKKFGLRGYSVASLRDNFGKRLVELGRLEEARTELLAALDLWTGCGSEYGASICRTNLGVIEQLAGNWAAAVRYHEGALEFVRRTGEPSGQVSSLGNLGEISLERGKLDAAEAYFAEAVAIAESLGDSATRGVLLRYLADIALRKNDLRAFLGRLRDGLPLVEAAGMKDEMSSFLRISGIFRARSKRTTDAETEFADSLRLAKESGSPLHQVATLRDWGGAILLSDPERGRALLKEARTLAASTGLRNEVREIEKQLGLRKKSAPKDAPKRRRVAKESKPPGDSTGA